MIALIQFEEIIDGTQVIFYAFTDGTRRTEKWTNIKSLLSFDAFPYFHYKLPDNYVTLVTNIANLKQLFTTHPELFI